MSLMFWLKMGAGVIIVGSLGYFGVTLALAHNPCNESNVIDALARSLPRDRNGDGIVVWHAVLTGGSAFHAPFSCQGDMTDLRGMSDLSTTPRQHVLYSVTGDSAQPEVRVLSVRPETP